MNKIIKINPIETTLTPHQIKILREMKQITYEKLVLMIGICNYSDVLSDLLVDYFNSVRIWGADYSYDTKWALANTINAYSNKKSSNTFNESYLEFFNQLYDYLVKLQNEIELYKRRGMELKDNNLKIFNKKIVPILKKIQKLK